MVDRKLFGCPRNASSVLVLDKTERSLNFWGLTRDVGRMDLKGVESGKEKEVDVPLSTEPPSVE